MARSTALSAYRRSYKGGAELDWHHPLFARCADLVRHHHGFLGPVLYPGCHRHLTAALVFPDVVFVDCDARVAELYTDAVARAYVEDHKGYPGPPSYRMVTASYEGADLAARHSVRPASFALLLSLSAGLVSRACSGFVRPGGFLLASDAHADARAAFVSGQWELKGVWDPAIASFLTDAPTLRRCFRVVPKRKRPCKNSIGKAEGASTEPPGAAGADGAEGVEALGPDPDLDGSVAMTEAHVEESVRVGAVAKRSFRVPFEPLLYLFQRKPGQAQKAGSEVGVGVEVEGEVGVGVEGSARAGSRKRRRVREP